MKKTVLIFGVLIVAVLTLVKLSKFSLMRGDSSIEIVIGGIAIVFFLIGMYLNRRGLRDSISEEKTTIHVEIDRQMIQRLGISQREYETLVEITKGNSNKEIAEALFLSESTIKTHVSNLYVKLNAKRRTQAIQIAKELNIIP